tara:strand:+ start:1243 stop:1518 length:276 start_codon:yes stop_codon:yes gene_type:complete
MPKFSDEPVSLPGITPRQHFIRLAGGLTGQRSYPFSAMIKGDFIKLMDNADAVRIRGALRTFYKSAKNTGRHFTVRPSADKKNYWVCRRVQ